MSRKQNSKPQQAVPPEEFDLVVAMIQQDQELRDDIEAVTGQSLEGKTPREMFNLYRAIGTAVDVQNAVTRYGQARQRLRQTRADLDGTASAEQVVGVARARITEAENRADELKAERDKYRAAYESLTSGNVTQLAKPVLQGQVAAS
ncbi:hypothetical protein [Nonomuraea basaltis]|uniref:hypothetical protein n=1 Tax=Nonomuraea basaltis TaxID=2495887 RepID=UPI00110C4834|nr:hypothetical protein [Nonomuraea basaltis]TMR91278.1 hypothetical protein EJK15_50700 [Nonomuraea basaltis]